MGKYIYRKDGDFGGARAEMRVGETKLFGNIYDTFSWHECRSFLRV